MKIEERRKEALVRRDSVQYFRLCEELGVLPELQDLFFEGAAQVGILKDTFQTRKEESENIGYVNFIKEAERIGIMRRLGEDSRRKADLLAKFFPSQFGSDGRQPINQYDTIEVGRVYINVMQQARKVVGRKR